MDISMRQLLEHLVDQRAPAVEPRSFADLFDRLIWLLADNGKDLLEVMNVWLEGDDLYRVRIALDMEEAFLFDTKEAMMNCFSRLVVRWPQTKGRCDEIVDIWDRTVASRNQ